MKITQLKVNHMENPLGFHMHPLSFSWKVEGAKGAYKQRSARIIIKQGESLLFDSGEDTDADSLDYRPDCGSGLVLKPRTRYEWTVSVTADTGETAFAQSWFETGKMEEAWNGAWIASVFSASVQPILAKEFQLNQRVEKARMYMCGLGVYELYINGKKVGDELLAPGYHSYDLHLQAQTYDATQYLKIGRNEIQIWLGDGWFKGRLGFDGGHTNLYGDKCCAIGELYVDCEDGGNVRVYTDGSWKCRQSPVLSSDIYDGESYDARLEKSDEWQNAVKYEPEKCGQLVDRYSIPVVKKESFAVREILHTPKEEYVLDFGQNLTGWVEFDCELPMGTADTAVGVYEGKWDWKNADTVIYEFSVPFGAEAQLYLPGERPQLIKSGTHQFTVMNKI